MKTNSKLIVAICIIAILAGWKFNDTNNTIKESPKTTGETAHRWSIEKANDWQQKYDWLVGANYIPSTAMNQLEMWQQASFDPKRIDQELQWANEIGFNTMRVFLHNLAWEVDNTGFIERMETFLQIADKHHIKIMFVLLDDVWNPNPKLGTQPSPTPHVHNAGWVQSPGKSILSNKSQWGRVKDYVQGVMSHFKDDKRVIIWDLYNEPGNPNQDSYGDIEVPNKDKHSLALLKNVTQWAREVNATQPLTIDIWRAIHTPIEKMNDIDQFAYNHSDIISFHCYAEAASTEKMVKELSKSGRPLLCTEYMARPVGSTFEDILPIFKKYHIAAYNWGFVSGKSQTIYPWRSWKKPLIKEPDLWFHDILKENGTPYKKEEVKFIKSLIQKN
ncbi:cellulase family glycosylhydrolase [Halosquirtibacter xylanolyticus]|uniref:hypothetical protein n=1 Tax=Halosquirtibacter xylanolyticus TaxID=3374599 RepID=UPI00374A7FEA|nr:cellulase family glycosylhydrolase [Prolixibacteraceae bacterium]